MICEHVPLCLLVSFWGGRRISDLLRGKCRDGPALTLISMGSMGVWVAVLHCLSHADKRMLR